MTTKLSSAAIATALLMFGATTCVPAPGGGSSDGAGSIVASPGADEVGRAIYLWNPNTGAMWGVHGTQERSSNAELSPDGRQLVYASLVPEVPPGTSPSDVSQIFVAEPGDTERQLTDLKSGAFEPTWSPDGRRIAFAAARSGTSDTDIFMMRADGSHVRRLFGTPYDDGHPDWSPDGSRIAFHARYGIPAIPGGLILVGSVRARTLSRLTPPLTPFGAVEPAWSPLGRWIAFSRFDRSTLRGRIVQAELWLMRPDGSHKQRIGARAPHDIRENPTWSPDGRVIAFGWNGTSRVRAINRRTGRVLTFFEEASGVLPSWDWSEEGFLVSLPAGGPAASPGLAPAGFQVQAVGVDATITWTGERCTRSDERRGVRPGPLLLELVNRSGKDGMFTMGRLAPGQTLAELREHPYAGWAPRANRYVDRSSARTWSSSRSVAGGTWAVTCWKDKIAALNGISMVPVGVVAIRIG